MSQAYSISTRRRFGLSRVCSVWAFPAGRSTGIVPRPMRERQQIWGGPQSDGGRKEPAATPSFWAT